MPITLEQTLPEYDCIVIGGGIGGLTAAKRLADFGRKVLVLEQHFELGGLAAYFKRGGHFFDTALHGFPVGMVKTCKKYWSREMADCIVPLETVRYDNPQFSLRTSFTTEDFTLKLRENFGIAQEAIDRFFVRCRAMNFYDEEQKTSRQLFEEFFPGRTDVMRFLMEPITYANGSTLEEPAVTYGIVFSNFMSKGVYFFQGGTDKFVRLAEKALEAAGGHLALSARADKILVENGRVAGVRVNGKTIRTRTVVSNANLKATVLDLLGPDALPPEFLRQTESVRLSSSICQVYIGIKRGETLPKIGDVVFHSTAPEFSPEGYLTHPPRSRSFSVYHPSARPGHDRYSVVASMGANYADWTGLSQEEYRRRKQELIDGALDAFATYVPNIRNMTDHLETATPLTFERYTLHPGGATFGTKFEGLAVSEGLPKTLPGAFHAGSAAIIMSGWLGAANYGVIVANQAEEYLYKNA